MMTDYPVVYLISADEIGRVKIGRSTAARVASRVGHLQCASPVGLSLVYSVPGDSVLETALHKKFRSHRVRGEWFSDEPEIRAWFAEHGPELERARKIAEDEEFMASALADVGAWCERGAQ